MSALAGAALEAGGRLTPAQAKLLRQRRAEGNAALWAAMADLGSAARSRFALLTAVEDALAELAGA